MTSLCCSLAVVLSGCGGGGNDDKTQSCTDLFTAPVSYAGDEKVEGCYFPGTYAITATVSQTAGTCNAALTWHVTSSGASHACSGTLSGTATAGYTLDFGSCANVPGSVHFTPALVWDSGHFSWTVACGSGTTTFQNMVKQP